MHARAKLTKKQKMWIAIAVFLFAVFVFSCVMFGIWATIEVSSRAVTYEQLKSKIGKYVVIPECLGEYATGSRIYFPDPEVGSKHHYGKYTNLTVKNKYFVSYYIDFKIGDVSGYFGAHKLSYQSPWEPAEQPLMTPEEIELYSYKEYVYEGVTYKYRFINRETNDIYEKNVFNLNFDDGDFNYSITASSLTADKEELINTIKMIWEDLK